MKKRTSSKLPFNLDPKLAGTVGTSVVVYVLTTVLGLDVTEELRASISVVIGSVAGWLIPPADAVAA